MNSGVGSRGSPMEKSISRSPASRMRRAMACTSAIGYSPDSIENRVGAHQGNGSRHQASGIRHQASARAEPDAVRRRCRLQAAGFPLFT